MEDHPKKERTLVVIKPDGVQRSLIGEIIKRFERVGLKLVGLKFFVPTEEFVKSHYLIDPNWPKGAGQKTIDGYRKRGQKPPIEDPEECGQQILRMLVKYLSVGPVAAMVWQGNQSVGIIRKLIGDREPLNSDVGTIRGDFTIDSYNVADTDVRAIRNLIHASGNVDEAEKEIALWFKPEEIISYRLISEEILYDVNLDGILE